MADVLVSVISAAVQEVLVDGKTLPAAPRGTRSPRARSTVRAGSTTVPHAAMATVINATSSRRNFSILATRQLFAHTGRADVVDIIRDREIAGATSTTDEAKDSERLIPNDVLHLGGCTSTALHF